MIAGLRAAPTFVTPLHTPGVGMAVAEPVVER